MEEGSPWYDVLKTILEAVAQWFGRCIPKYEPEVWNDGNGVQHHNNCYNYACDIITGTYAQPGEASGNKWTQLNCADVAQGAVSDGLVPVDCDTGCGCKECWHQVALVMWPGRDYHWCRRDRSGNWSHKPGGAEATNLDNSNNPITDPRTADWGPYQVFCGCYCVNKQSVTIT